MERRKFLKLGLGLGGTALLSPNLFGKSNYHDKVLHLHNVHTGESIKSTFWQKDDFVVSELQRLNYFLRDFRSMQVANMDINLFSLLYAIQQNMGGTKKPIDVISGYRSPWTNDFLRKHHHEGVAKKSYHLRAQAIDFNIKDKHLRDTLKIAKLMELGGVGYYPNSKFIHVDTGPVRTWVGS